MKFVAPAAAVAAVAGVLSMASPASAAERHTVIVDEHQNHATVTVHQGDRIRLVLHNTYWSIDRAHGHALATRGSQKTAGHIGPGCVPGSGCGTATRTFTARQSGTTRLTADRTSCGEAMRCTAGQGHFSVRIRVVR